MCVTFFGFHIPINQEAEGNHSETLRLFVAFNRDEITTRKALKAERHGDVIHGVDEETKSTWLAINTVTNRVAFLTNFRHPSNHVKKGWLSRGRLIMDWVYIEGEVNEEAERVYEQENFDKLSKYRGFNLVYGRIGKAADTTNFKYISNFSKEIIEEQQPMKLESGRLYGMCNGLIEDWVKVKRGKEKVQSYLDKFDDIAWTSNSNSLSQSQSDKIEAFSSELITHFLEEQEGQYDYYINELFKYRYFWNCPKTGVSIIAELNNSPIFVPSNWYKFSTVSSTSLIVCEDGEGIFYERTYKHPLIGLLLSAFITCMSFIHASRDILPMRDYSKSDEIIKFTLSSD